MKPKDEAREWLDRRCGQKVNVQTHLVNAAITPVVNEGSLTKSRTHNAQIADAWEDSGPVRDLYQVGATSYNLADLPDDIKVQIRTEPAEQLEMTFDDGTSLLITALITVIKEEGQE